MVTYRQAETKDTALILGFIRELADYEKMLHEVKADENTLKQSLFSENSHVKCLIAEVDGVPAAFALYFYNFSTFLGRGGIYIEDIYVKPEFRGHGIGKGFFKKLAQEAKNKNLGRIEWWVLNWNKPAIEFYEKIEAVAMDEWTVFRLTSDKISKLAE